jgi:molybdate transport repressor ModE-like protein
LQDNTTNVSLQLYVIRRLNHPDLATAYLGDPPASSKMRRPTRIDVDDDAAAGSPCQCEADRVACWPRAWHSGGMARVNISIVFESGARIGPGKAKLLESIRDTGSISAAAREMRMDYKRAWVLLDSMNQAFIEPVVTAAPAGAGGGGAVLGHSVPRCLNATSASMPTPWLTPPPPIWRLTLPAATSPP